MAMETHAGAKPVVNYVSGHLALTPAEFEAHYRPAIDAALARGERFVVGDARGTDAMTQNYLLGKTTAVVVYHMFTSPRNNAGFQTVGGFGSDAERDARRVGHAVAVVPHRENRRVVFHSQFRQNVDRPRRFAHHAKSRSAEPDDWRPAGLLERVLAGAHVLVK